MSEEKIQRSLITKYKIENTQVRLWVKGLRRPELLLFDVSDLQEAAIDYEKTEKNVEIPCRFWAYWLYAEKTKSTGSHYKNVIRLEPLDLPATATSVDSSAIVAELRAIKALLLQVLQTPSPEPARDPYPAGSPTADEPTASSKNDIVERLLTNHKPDTSGPPKPNNGHRIKFYDLAATCQDQTLVDTIASVASDHGFAVALQCLEAEIKRGPDTHRQKIITRLNVLLQHNLVKTGKVGAGLIPGWNWRLENDQLLEAGKRILADIETASGSV